jgi:hypothetical protein
MTNEIQNKQKMEIASKIYLRDRPFNLQGGYGVFFRSEIFFRTARALEYLFFFVALSAKLFSRI